MKLNKNYADQIHFVCGPPDQYGAGHLIRCSYLALEFIILGFNCRFFIKTKISKKIIDKLDSRIKIERNFNDLYNCRWLIVDHYDWCYEKENVKKDKIGLIKIDDYFNTHKFYHIIINSSLTFDKKKYNKISKNISFLSGNEAHIIDQFYTHYKKKKSKKTMPKTILLNLGFSISEKVISSCLKILLTIYKSSFITVLCGDLVKYKVLFSMHNDSKNRFDLLEFSKLDESFYNRFDLVFGGCGVNSIERYISKIPSINLKLSENQSSNYNFYKRKKALVFDYTIKNNEIKFSRFLTNISNAQITKSTNNMSNVYDGLGSRRCILKMCGMKKLNNQKVWFSHISINDIKFLFDLRNENSTKMNSRRPPPKNFLIHKKWFFEKMNFKPLIFAVIKLENKSVGTIRLESLDIKNKDYEIFINISEKFQGKGIAKIALNLLNEITYNINIYANVLEHNERSRKLFLKAGFLESKKNWYLKS